MPENTKNGEVYVTYKSLVISLGGMLLTVIALIITLSLTVLGGVDKKIDCKVDQTVFAESISHLKEADASIMAAQVTILEKLTVLHDNQIRVMDKVNVLAQEGVLREKERKAGDKARGFRF